MNSSYLYYKIHFGLSIVYIEGSQVIISKKYCFITLKINFVLANSADSDEMLHYAAFHLCLHCLPKYLFYKGLMYQYVGVNLSELKG